MTKHNNEIDHLEFPENIRKRYGMYIGSSSDSDVLVREIIDNSIDEFYNNTKPGLLHIYHNDNKVLVADNGRGLPLLNHKTSKDINGDYYTQARLAVEKLHAGSKFNNDDAVVTVGTNGVGSAVVNALSSRFILFVNMNRYEEYSDKINSLLKNRSVNRDMYYMVEYHRGILQKESLVRLSPEYIKDELGLDISFNVKDMSTLVYFIPDETIIQSKKITIPNLKYRKYITKLLYKKDISIYVNDELYENIFEPYKYQFKSMIGNNTFLISLELSNNLEKEKFTGSVNGLIVNQGIHKDWTIRAYRDAVKDYFGNLNTYESYGLVVNTIVLSSNPHYTSQTKTELSQLDKITYTHAKQLVESFKLIFKKNYEVFKDHYDQLVIFTSKLTNISRKSIIESKVSLTSKSSRFIKPEKLTDCYTTNREEAELFIVEGDSAGSGVIAARDPQLHAVYALKGKPLNSVNLDIVDVLENKEMNGLISAIGTGVDDYNDLSKVRYGKILLISDEDQDGQHIKMLLSGFFLSHMKYLIEAGMVYITKNPLYSQNHNFYLADEFNKIDQSKPFTRFKGLGECNPDQLREFLIDKDKRILQRLTLKDIENTLDLLTSADKKREVMINNNFFKFNQKLEEIYE